MIVELDLPREIQALPMIYEQYWHNKEDWLMYDDFYQKYYEDVREATEVFRNDIGFSEESFQKVLKARIYRTWASLITQIQAGYVCEDIFDKNFVTMSADLDWRGIDFIITLGNKTAKMQIKKETYSAGVLKGLAMDARFNAIKNKKNDLINIIVYYMPPIEKFLSNGSKRKQYIYWEDKYKGKLKLLDNGFVIFEKDMFKDSALNFQ